MISIKLILIPSITLFMVSMVLLFLFIVMHMCYLISSLPENQKIFTNHEIFAIVFSGLCHDVGPVYTVTPV